MGEIGLEVDEETVRRTRTAIEEKAAARIDSQLARLILGQIDGTDADARKETVVKALIAFTWEQRLYFIIRSAVMGILGAVVTGAIVVFFGEVNALQVAAASVFSFVATLAMTRHFEAWITNGSKKIVATMSEHRRLRDAVLDHF
jgi:ribose/xylose/arabinose/galactoside ABC-type transport system permease subunit